LAGAFCVCQGGQEQAGKDSDERYHHEQFDEREGKL
jgi:hypothetical protein